MDGQVVRIERAKNGFTVEMRDPEIEKRNRERDEKEDGPVGYESPFVSFVFESTEAVLEFLGKNLEKAMPLDEFDTSFEEAAAKERSNG